MRFYWWLLLIPGVVAAKTESGPQLYNQGVTAYESNDFLRAAALFENATASADRALQQRALYNLGNASYRLGETQPAQAQQLWQRALKHYESALGIDPQDADAKFNHDFVKKKLEELKQQQEQQQQEDNKQDQNQDDQQQQPKNGQQQNPQDKQSDQQQSKQSESKEQQPQEEPPRNEQQKPPAQQEQQPQDEQPTQQRDGQPQSYEKMQAAALLDSLREDERNWNFFPEVQMQDLKDTGKPAKDW